MPSAATGETLTERAQRILGLDLDTWLANELKTEDQSVAASRSEQIAQAQRKHRQRTQSYIQALEQEVLRLRSVEVASKEEVEKLRKQIDTKQDHPEAPVSDLSTPSLRSDGGTSNTNSPEAVMVDFVEAWNGAAEQYNCMKTMASTPVHGVWEAPSSDAEGSPSSQPAVSWAQKLNSPPLSEADTAAIKDITNFSGHDVPLNPGMGVNFILQLEGPCLGHVKHAVLNEPLREGDYDAPANYGTNHVYNLSTRLYHDYATHASDASIQETHITSQDLNQLLEASERLQLHYELTPVQVWSLVCKLNSVHPIDHAVIDAMFGELAKYSYCNSFGTALNKDTVKAALQYFLGWSHV